MVARPIEPAHSLLLSTFFLHVYLSAVCVGIAHPLAVWLGLFTSYLPVSLPGCVAAWSTTCSELSFLSRTACLPAWAFLLRPRRGLAQSLLPRAAPECAIGLSRCVSAVFSARPLAVSLISRSSFGRRASVRYFPVVLRIALPSAWPLATLRFFAFFEPHLYALLTSPTVFCFFGPRLPAPRACRAAFLVCPR